MKRILLAALCATALSASAQQLTAGQVNTVRTAACADATAKTYINSPNVQSLMAWVNGVSTTDAWLYAATRTQLFEATNITKFDALTAGKRDAWRLMLDNAPIDFGRNPMRNAVVDAWGNTDSVTVLQALTEKATRAQAAIGGTSKTTNTVTALDRTYTGTVSQVDTTRLIFADNGTQFTCP